MTLTKQHNFVKFTTLLMIPTFYVLLDPSKNWTNLLPLTKSTFSIGWKHRAPSQKSQILFMILCSILTKCYAFFMISGFILCHFYAFQTQNNNLRQNFTPWVNVTSLSVPMQNCLKNSSCNVHLKLKTCLTLCLLQFDSSKVKTFNFSARTWLKHWKTISSGF